MARMMRPAKVPDGVLLSEIAFLRAATVCHAIEQVAPKKRDEMIAKVHETIIGTFRDEDLEDAPSEVQDHYSGQTMEMVVTEAMRKYAELGYMPMLTCHEFRARVQGFGEMGLEVKVLIDRLSISCEGALRKFRLL